VAFVVYTKTRLASSKCKYKKDGGAMSEYAWMPFYVADYLADTGHLTTLQHGAYLLLIMHYWQTGALPRDDHQLALIARLPAKQWQSNRDVLARLFGRKWTHKRIDAELERAEKKRKNLQKAALERHSKTNGLRKNASQMHVSRATLTPQSQESSLRSDSSAPNGAQSELQFSKPQKPTPRDELLKVLDGEHADAVIDHRQRLRKPLTAYAAKLLAKKLVAAPDANAAADAMVAHGWLGFEPEWVLNDRRVKTTGPPDNSMAAAFDTVFGARRA
jgi:uncharacterized protein YdaU (DUF1376 family)